MSGQNLWQHEAYLSLQSWTTCRLLITCSSCSSVLFIHLSEKKTPKHGGKTALWIKQGYLQAYFYVFPWLFCSLMTRGIIHLIFYEKHNTLPFLFLFFCFYIWMWSDMAEDPFSRTTGNMPQSICKEALSPEDISIDLCAWCNIMQEYPNVFWET